MNTKKLKELVLDLAIHGKLVPQDPNDEPASVLLERIRNEKERLVKEGKIKKSKSTTSSDTPPYENVPFEVPNGWCMSKLSDLCMFLSRGKSPKYSETDSGYPVYAQKCNLKDGGISIKQARFLDPSTLEKWPEKFRLKTGDVLVNSTGTGTVGRTRLFDENCLGKYPFVLPDSHVSIVRTYPEISSEFVFYVLYSEYGQNYFNDNLAGSTNQKELYIGVLGDMSIYLPPLAEQQRIVTEIERWFSVIDALEANEGDLLKTIDQAKKKILDLAIRGKLVVQDPNDEPASELLKRLGESSDNRPYENVPFEVPSGWVWCHINEIAQSMLGKTLDKNKDKGVLKDYLCAVNVQWFSFDFSMQKQFLIEEKDFERYAIIKGDILVCEGGDVGRTAIWNEDREIYYQNALHRIRVNESVVLNTFLSYVLCFFKSKGTIDELCKGVTIKHFTQATMNKLDIPLPPLAEQKRIVEKIESLYAQLDAIANALD